MKDTTMTDTPIVITMGDPSGVGAEVIVKAMAALSPEARQRYAVIGDTAVLQRACAVCGLDLPLVPYGTDAAAGSLAVIEVPIPGLPDQFGVLAPECGEAAFRYIERAVEMTSSGEAQMIVTAPINKEALNRAGHHYDGHTGMLTALTHAKSSRMLLASETLNVLHVTAHVSLKDSVDRATSERVLETILMGDHHLKRMGLSAPRIAVAGINPHCGEAGLFGKEDDQQLVPAIQAAQEQGVNVVGPIPADTLYYRAHKGEFDLVIAQFHDQGHIPIKLIAFDTAVNVTLGLPIDRCSVDHGTAFDIAGTGQANHVNMLAALDYAGKLVAEKQG